MIHAYIMLLIVGIILAAGLAALPAGSQRLGQQDYNKRGKVSDCHRLKGKGGNRLALLPCSIRSSIISSLTIKEAVVTSAVCKGWRHLWRDTQTLVLEDKTFVPTGADLDERAQKKKEQLKKFVEWIDRILNQHVSITIDVFKIKSGLGSRHDEAITRWLILPSRKK
ncbi:hypothetical protein OSB04_027205 [Centaurea solstitialis]|uniref:F-box domain-containing protein n=1 Tax=Centaurea solstitialis TaxID=347529 RepID=A0AA38SET0_9ASTR|nr:hypothetical protein OSB04_027205 [Centaurea solstitialis]